MEINLQTRNFEASPALREYVSKKISKLTKYLNVEEAQVTLTVNKDRHIVEVTTRAAGLILRGEEDTEDMYASLDLVVDKLERQIEKYKTRLTRGIRDLRRQPQTEDEGIPAEERPLILRSKRFAMKPMAVEEAVMQMNLLGHSFFVFSNADTEEVNVVYRRRDGNYGLIEPE